MPPSQEHRDLQWMALRWLTGRATKSGIRGATEIGLSKGYVADAAALCGLQARYAEAYRERSGLRLRAGPEQICGDVSHYVSCVFEVKVSRNDFWSTFGDGDTNRWRAVADLHWIVTPRGLLKPHEKSTRGFWGLLEVSGRGLAERVIPIWQWRSDAQHDAFAHRLLWPILKGRAG